MASRTRTTTQFIWIIVMLMILFARIASPFHHPAPSPAQQRKGRISLYSGDKKKNLSASERERRDEEERRRKRRDDVVIGKTSAKKGEKDFSLDPKSTEEEYLRQASNIEQRVFQLTEAGLESLNSLQLEDADSAFEEVFKLKSNAYLWQAGIVKFYLGDIVGAGRIFARNAELYESRFGCPASEERIWRDACELKYLSSLSKENRRALLEEGTVSKLIPKIPAMNEENAISLNESRMVLKVARELFSSSVSSDQSEELLARAKLRSIGGSTDSSPMSDRKLRKLTSWYYLGLHYDSQGNNEESKKCMKMALRSSPSSGKSNDIVHTLPLLHMAARDWFDDDEMETEIIFDDDFGGRDETGFSPTTPSEAIAGMAYADPNIEKAIKDGVAKMKIRELKDALRLRSKTTTGSKEELQERLFYSLMDDAGFSSGFAP